MKRTYSDTFTIMITGGHITPALAVIAELKTMHPGVRSGCAGRKTATEGAHTLSEEYRIIRDMRIPFAALSAGRLKRDGGPRAVTSLLKVPVGFVQALRYVRMYTPDIIVSFGGYVALPVVIAARLFRIPVITHEQTTRPGLANRIISRLSEVTCTGFPPEVLRGGLSGKVIYTGLPIRAGVFAPPKKTDLPVPEDDLPLLLIVGGSTGAVSVNTVVYRALPELVSRYRVIHQVGRPSLSRAREEKRGLTAHADRYIPVPYLPEPEYAWALAHAALIIGRSGANTVTEIAATGKTALFIPLPWASGNEQHYNAKVLADAGSADILLQDTLTDRGLVRAIARMLAESGKHAEAAARIAKTIPRDGAHRFAEVVDTVLAGK